MNNRVVIRSLVTNEGCLVAMDDGAIVWRPTHGTRSQFKMDAIATVLLAIKGPTEAYDIAAIGDAGGGVTLVRAQSAAQQAENELSHHDEATGARIVAKALEGPLHQIAVNAGLEGGVVVEKVRNLKGANGLNASTGEYEDLVKAGVIDAAKVTRSALQNAGSIAALFLTTEAVIADAPEENSTRQKYGKLAVWFCL